MGSNESAPWCSTMLDEPLYTSDTLPYTLYNLEQVGKNCSTGNSSVTSSQGRRSSQPCLTRQPQGHNVFSTMIDVSRGSMQGTTLVDEMNPTPTGR
jgi:hypothetical protein